MQRDYFICCLVGQITTKYPNISAEDLRIAIDQRLTNCNLSNLGSEETDVQLLQDLLDETMMSVLLQGVNREQRRKVLNEIH